MLVPLGAVGESHGLSDQLPSDAEYERFVLLKSRTAQTSVLLKSYMDILCCRVVRCGGAVWCGGVWCDEQCKP